MAVFGCAVYAMVGYGTVVYFLTAPEIPRVSLALIAGSCSVGAISGVLGFRLGTFLERARQ